MVARLASGILACAALASCAGPPARDPAIPDGAGLIDCVNVVSGFRWELRLDAARKTVDGWPAALGPGSINWRDGSDNAGYSLDRTSGALTVTRASSTGGVVNTDRCTAARS